MIMLCVTASSAIAQLGSTGDSGDFAGGVHATYYIPQNSEDMWGLGFDVVVGKYVVDNLYLNGGLGVQFNSLDDFENNEFDLTALRLPVNLGFRLPVSSSGHPAIAIYTGPRFTYAIAGKGKLGGIDYDKLSDVDSVQRFNAYWSAGATIDLWGFGISVEYMVLMGKKTDLSSGMLGIGAKIAF